MTVILLPLPTMTAARLPPPIDSMDVTPTSLTAVKKWRTYKKRGGAQAAYMKEGMHDGSITNAPNREPRLAKTNAIATILEMSVDAPSSDNVVKLD